MLPQAIERTQMEGDGEYTERGREQREITQRLGGGQKLRDLKRENGGERGERERERQSGTERKGKLVGLDFPRSA